MDKCLLFKTRVARSGQKGYVMSNIREEVLRANDEFVSVNGASFRRHQCVKFSILTCMDARIDPAKLAGLRERDAHVIRNGGERASDDAIRSLVISYRLLGARERFVIHHTNCGMELFSDAIMRGLLASSLETSSYDGKTWKDTGRGKGSPPGVFVDWLTIQNQAKSVALDVERIKTQPPVPKHSRRRLHSSSADGRLVEIPEATEIGRAA